MKLTELDLTKDYIITPTIPIDEKKAIVNELIDLINKITVYGFLTSPVPELVRDISTVSHRRRRIQSGKQYEDHSVIIRKLTQKTLSSKKTVKYEPFPENELIEEEYWIYDIMVKSNPYIVVFHYDTDKDGQLLIFKHGSWIKHLLKVEKAITKMPDDNDYVFFRHSDLFQ